MKKEEKDFYQKLSKIQKEFVDALKKLGFTHKYFTTYELPDWGQINVSTFNNWSELLKVVHEQGKDQKRFEIQRVLGI